MFNSLVSWAQGMFSFPSASFFSVSPWGCHRGLSHRGQGTCLWFIWREPLVVPTGYFLLSHSPVCKQDSEHRAVANVTLGRWCGERILTDIDSYLCDVNQSYGVLRVCSHRKKTTKKLFIFLSFEVHFSKFQGLIKQHKINILYSTFTER